MASVVVLICMCFLCNAEIWQFYFGCRCAFITCYARDGGVFYLILKVLKCVAMFYIFNIISPIPNLYNCFTISYIQN
jgi:hypothetical protein